MDSDLSSWFGQVYGKIEAMGLEVEEIINQNAVKYVENQVKTVGDCVKKLYTDTIEDFLPVSSDVQVNSEHSDSSSVNNIDSGIYDKSEEDTEREDVEIGSVNLIEDNSFSTKLDDDCMLHNLCEMQSQDLTVLVIPDITEVLARSEVSETKFPLSSDDSVNLEHLGSNYDKYEVDTGREDVNVENASLSEDFAAKLDECVLHNLCELQSQDSSVLVKPNITEVLTRSEISDTESAKDGDCTAEEAKLRSEMEESRENDECVYNIPIHSSSSEETSLSDSLSSSSGAISISHYVNEEDVSKTSNGMPYQPTVDEIGDMEELQLYEKQVDDMNQDESCVLVDENELFTISSVSRLEGKQRSYKKKIKDLLYMRRWSSRKNHEREYTSFSHQGSWITEASSSALDSFNSNLKSNSLESGWEIL